MIMKTVTTFITISIILIAVLFVGCEYENTPVATDPREEGAPPPEITSIEPEEEWLAGVDKIVINGNNFSEIPENNLVYFNDKKGTILDASPTQLNVRPPVDAIGDSIRVRVSVMGAVRFSNTIYYSLEQAVEQWGGLPGSQLPWGVAVDGDDNLYVATEGPGELQGIQKITPDGESSEYSPRQGWIYISLRMGPDGYLYTARGPAIQAILYRVEPGGGTPSPWIAAAHGIGRVRDMDFDANDYLWIGGNNEELYRASLDQEVTAFPFDQNVTAVRVFDDYLYVASQSDGEYNIWRFPLDAQSDLGEKELYFAFSDEIGDPEVAAYSLTFSADGEMFVGTDRGDYGMIIVYPDRSWEPFYPALIKPKTRTMTWGDGHYMYLSREEYDEPQRLFRVNTLREGAPYYGAHTD